MQCFFWVGPLYFLLLFEFSNLLFDLFPVQGYQLTKIPDVLLTKQKLAIHSMWYTSRDATPFWSPGYNTNATPFGGLIEFMNTRWTLCSLNLLWLLNVLLCTFIYKRYFKPVFIDRFFIWLFFTSYFNTFTVSYFYILIENLWSNLNYFYQFHKWSVLSKPSSPNCPSPFQVRTEFRFFLQGLNL